MDIERQDWWNEEITSHERLKIKIEQDLQRYYDREIQLRKFFQERRWQLQQEINDQTTKRDEEDFNLFPDNS